MRPLPEQLRDRPFTRDEAIAAGLTLQQLRSSRVRRLFRGCYADAAVPVSAELRMVAALRAVGGDCAITGISALALHGVQLPARLFDASEIHVLRYRGTSCRGQPGLVVHTTRRPIRALEHRRFPGLRFTDLTTAWLSLAMAGASVYTLVLVGDALMRRRRARTSVAALQARVDQAGLVPGIANARRAVRLIRPNTDSFLESHVRLLVLCAGLPEPVVNYELEEGDRVIAYLDMAYVAMSIDLEYDGDQHRWDPRQWRRDQDRTRATAARGWYTIRCSASILADPEPFLADLRRVLLQRGWDGRPTGFPYTREELGIPQPGRPPSDK